MTESESIREKTKEKYNDLSKEILEVVSKYTFFPTPIVHSQFRRLKKEANEITYEDIPRLADIIGEALANFTTYTKGVEVREAILQLRKN
jgi:hypothetical protein